MSSSLSVTLVSVEMSRLASVSMETLDSRLLLVTFVSEECWEARELGFCRLEATSQMVILALDNKLGKN